MGVGKSGVGVIWETGRVLDLAEYLPKRKPTVVKTEISTKPVRIQISLFLREQHVFGTGWVSVVSSSISFIKPTKPPEVKIAYKLPLR